MNATSSTKTATRTVDLGGLEVGDDVFGYIAPPGTITPPPVVLKWVQSLDLAHSLKDCRRNLANGFYVAQIYSRFFPTQVMMHSFENGHGTACKTDNWAQIQKFHSKWQGQPLPQDLITDTIQGAPGAGVVMLCLLYEVFTGKTIPQRPPSPPPEAEPEEEEQQKRRPVAAPVVKKGRAPKKEEAVEDSPKPKNYGIMGSKPISSAKPAQASAVEFGKAGKIQLIDGSDVQELRRRLQNA
mmetsp:Transcript_9024/g.16269  ORF Transcript_9024/g.16269 Transcript_9024/m.16269 type:complete len:240 (-) Transcript_9024:315-1034(-)